MSPRATARLGAPPEGAADVLDGPVWRQEAVGYERSMAVAALITVWASTAVTVIVVAALWLALGRDRNTGESDGPGLPASWWGTTALICFAAGVGGLVKGLWAAVVFLVPGAWAARRARRRAREGNF